MREQEPESLAKRIDECVAAIIRAQSERNLSQGGSLIVELQKLLVECDALRTRAETAEQPKPIRQFPLQWSRSEKDGAVIKSCPWPVAEIAYNAYAKMFGTSQSLERLAERGGFGTGEMDNLYPTWREHAESLSDTVMVRRSAYAELQTHLTAAHDALAKVRVVIRERGRCRTCHGDGQSHCSCDGQGCHAQCRKDPVCWFCKGSCFEPWALAALDGATHG